MADIKSISGNPIKVGTSGIEDGAITDAKLASDSGFIADISAFAKRTITLTADDVIEGGFIGVNGGYNESPIWYCTDYIDVFGCGGSSVRMTTTLYGNGGCAWYDTSKTCLGYLNENNASEYGYSNAGDNLINVTIKVPTGTRYVRMSKRGTLSDPSDFHVECGYFNDAEASMALQGIPAINDEITEIKSAIGDIEYYNLVDPSKFVANTYIYAATGRVDTTNNNWSATDYIRLKPNTTYYMGSVYANGFYAFYDLDKTFVASPDVTVTPSSNNWYGTIETGDTEYLFRGTATIASGASSLPYISSLFNSYHEYGIVPIFEQSKEKSNRSRVLVLGDSISTDYYGDYKKWVTVLEEDGFLPPNTVNSSQHASGFVARYNSGENDFISRVQAIEDKSEYDMVIVFGGINDYIQSVPLGGGEGETDIRTYFKAAVDYFFDYLIQNFTQARICVLLPLRTYATWTNSVGEYQQAYGEYIHEVAKSYCLPVLNLTEESGFCPYIQTFRDMWTLVPSGYTSSDGVHPNETYEREFLAPMIREFLKAL